MTTTFIELSYEELEELIKYKVRCEIVRDFTSKYECTQEEILTLLGMEDKKNA